MSAAISGALHLSVCICLSALICCSSLLDGAAEDENCREELECRNTGGGGGWEGDGDKGEKKREEIKDCRNDIVFFANRGGKHEGYPEKNRRAM